MYAVHDVIWQYLTGGKWDKKEDKVGKKRLVTNGYGVDLFGGGFYCNLAALLSFKDTLWVCMLLRYCPCAAHLHYQDVTVFLFYYECTQIIHNSVSLIEVKETVMSVTLCKGSKF